MEGEHHSLASATSLGMIHHGKDLTKQLSGGSCERNCVVVSGHLLFRQFRVHWVWFGLLTPPDTENTKQAHQARICLLCTHLCCNPRTPEQRLKRPWTAHSFMHIVSPYSVLSIDLLFWEGCVSGTNGESNLQVLVKRLVQCRMKRSLRK